MNKEDHRRSVRRVPDDHPHERLGGQCPVFAKCGGCSCLNTPYRDQLIAKQMRISELFDGLCDEAAVFPISGMRSPLHYRDKIISPFVRSRGRKGKPSDIVCGMYMDGTHKVVPIEQCIVENPIGQKIMRAVRSIMLKHGIEPYDEDSGCGFLRHVLVRIGHESDEVLVTIVTNTKEFPHAKSFCKELRAEVPEITTIVQNVNMRQTNVILGDEEHTLYGPGFILDELEGLKFRISSKSFYQVNKEMTSVLYSKAIDLADVEGKVVIDAYCGTGTLGLACASKGAKKILGVDSVHDSIKDARLNAKHNGIENAEFIAADATDFMLEVAAKGRLDGEDVVILMDPPRAGSTVEFIDAACSVNPCTIVYISCNPKTQVRDVERFQEDGYRIESIHPVDMFPHTDHIENIVKLIKA